MADLQAAVRICGFPGGGPVYEYKRLSGVIGQSDWQKKSFVAIL
jgi:hypothetical protein